MAESKTDPADQLVDYLIYAPVGIALEAIDNFPKYVERGKSQVTLGRFLVRTAAKKGSATVESLAGRVANEAGQVIVDLFNIDLSVDAPVEADADPVANVLVPSDAELPIADYDSQAAAQIVKLLAQLSSEELGLIEAYESGRRKRVTILRKIAQLRDAS